MRHIARLLRLRLSRTRDVPRLARLPDSALGRPTHADTKFTGDGTAAVTPFGDVKLMLQSHVIEIDGRFVGAAVRLDCGYRFVAVDFRLEDLDGTTWPTLADVQRLARRLCLVGNVEGPPGQPSAGSRGSHVPKSPDPLSATWS